MSKRRKTKVLPDILFALHCSVLCGYFKDSLDVFHCNGEQKRMILPHLADSNWYYVAWSDLGDQSLQPSGPMVRVSRGQPLCRLPRAVSAPDVTGISLTH